MSEHLINVLTHVNTLAAAIKAEIDRQALNGAKEAMKPENLGRFEEEGQKAPSIKPFPPDLSIACEDGICYITPLTGRGLKFLAEALHPSWATPFGGVRMLEGRFNKILRPVLEKRNLSY